MAHILSETTTDKSTLTYADNGIYLSKIISFMCLVARIVKNMRRNVFCVKQVVFGHTFEIGSEFSLMIAVSIIIITGI